MSVLQRTTQARDQWKQKSEQATRERNLEEQAAEERASGLEAAEARSRLAEDRLETARSRAHELETTAAQSVLLRTEVSRLREELEASHAENLLVSSAQVALKAQNEINEKAHGRAVSRHQDTVAKLQTLVSDLRAEQTSSLLRAHEAAAKSGANEELARSASDAKEQADLRVIELEGQLHLQRNLVDKASIRYTDAVDSMRELDRERREALTVAGEAEMKREAATIREDQSEGECARLRSLCDARAEECTRLQTLQLTDRSVTDPTLPAKLQETENYLKRVTDAFHKLKSDAVTMEGTLSRQLTESREQVGDFTRLLAASRSETANISHQLTIAQSDLTHTQDLPHSQGHGDSHPDRSRSRHGSGRSTDRPPHAPSVMSMTQRFQEAAATATIASDHSSMRDDREQDRDDDRSSRQRGHERSRGSRRGGNSDREQNQDDSRSSRQGRRERSRGGRGESSDEREQDQDDRRSSRQGCRGQSQGSRGGGRGDPDEDSDHSSSDDSDGRDRKKRGQDKGRGKGKDRDRDKKRGRKSGDPPEDGSDSPSSSDSDSRSSDSRRSRRSRRRTSRSRRHSSSRPKPVMTSGQTHCGVTKKEYFEIQALCLGNTLEAEMMAVLDATYDQTMGTRPHSISLARFDKYASYDKRLGSQIVNDLMNGKLRLFTKAIGDSTTRVAAWCGNDPGSRIMMIKVLQSAVANGCNLMNLVTAMECQVRTHSAATDDLQAALILSLNQMRAFANTFADHVPLSYAGELMVKLIDTVIVGPSTALGVDAKRAYEEAKKTGSLTATSRYFEGLAVMRRDPSGSKKLSRSMFWDDEQSALELQEDFLKLYTHLPEYHGLVLEMQTWFLDRNATSGLEKFRDPSKVSLMEHRGICACAKAFEHKEMAISKYGANPAGLGKERSRTAVDPTRRVNSVEGLKALEQQVAALRQDFRDGGGGRDGTSPPVQASSRGRPTVSDGIVGAARGHRVAAYERSPSPSPSLSSSTGAPDQPTFISDDGNTYWKGVGSPEGPLSEVIRATESFYNLKIPLDLLKIPAHIPTDEYVNTLEVRGHLLNAVFDGGKCDAQTARDLAKVSPAAAYGGFNEPEEPTYTSEKVVMQKRSDGAMQWAKQACGGCAFSPPWDSNNGSPPHLCAALFRNEVGCDHNPRRCRKRLMAALLTRNPKVISALMPEDRKWTQLLAKYPPPQ